ncbi:hypothetical protein [Paenibacillus vortex]|uniref:hypothetical protein n=1 Tax=Paenibacillus sp. FSL W8-1287 TaxID=2954653 RepID=UPI001F26B0E9
MGIGQPQVRCHLRILSEAGPVIVLKPALIPGTYIRISRSRRCHRMACFLACISKEFPA